LWDSAIVSYFYISVFSTSMRPDSTEYSFDDVTRAIILYYRCSDSRETQTHEPLVTCVVTVPKGVTPPIKR